MANTEHLNILKRGVSVWNQWRKENPGVSVDLSGADLMGDNLSGMNLSEADLSNAKLGMLVFGAGYSDYETRLIGANLRGAKLRHADVHYGDFTEADLGQADLSNAYLFGAHFIRANLRGSSLYGAMLHEAHFNHANLENADLKYASLIDTDMSYANLTSCQVYGTSVWGVTLDKAKQDGLVITHPHRTRITVENLEVAQFVQLLVNNKRIRSAIDTITSKVALILGRFTPERKVVLDGLRDELRKRDYVPIIFDFEKPVDRDFTETVLTLAGMSRFIIADLTQPKSSPLESFATITNFMVPFIPIIQEGEWPFAMFVDLKRKHHWVLNSLKYKDKNDLQKWIDKIISKANAKYNDIQLEKAKPAEEPASGEEW